MRGITIHQPYAQLIAIEAKQYETRPMATKYRGPVAIHAGLARDQMAFFFTQTEWAGETWRKQNEAMTRAFATAKIGCVTYGAIIAYADLVNCFRIETVYQLTSERERLFGDWSTGRYAWEIANVQRLATPIPCKGQLGLWNVKPEMIGGHS